jgi:MFS family permease
LGFSYLPDVTGAILIAAGVVGLVLFFWRETRADDPILSVDLFLRNRVFAFSNAAALINYAATFAMTFLLSLYLQYNRGLDAQEAGLVLVPGLFVQAVLSVVAGRLADRLPSRILASVGMGLTVLGLFAFAFLAGTTPYWYIFTVLCVLGIGFALFATPITHTIMGSVEKRQVGTASATLATMRMTGQNLSMGLATLVLAIVVGRHEVEPVDYPHFLTSARISFAIFAALCVLGVAASLVGPRRQRSSD